MGLRLVFAGLFVPIVSASFAGLTSKFFGMSTGEIATFSTLAACVSYVTAPIAVKAALPGANPCIYSTTTLGIALPLNLTLGVPLYIFLAEIFS